MSGCDRRRDAPGHPIRHPEARRGDPPQAPSAVSIRDGYQCVTNAASRYERGPGVTLGCRPQRSAFTGFDAQRRIAERTISHRASPMVTRYHETRMTIIGRPDNRRGRRFGPTPRGASVARSPRGPRPQSIPKRISTPKDDLAERSKVRRQGCASRRLASPKAARTWPREPVWP
jgi:hypothetical protein